MTETSDTNSGTTSEPSTPLPNGSTEKSGDLNLSSLLKGDIDGKTRKKEVGAADGNVSDMSGGDPDPVRDLAERLLDASEQARSDQENASTEEQDVSTDARERPPGLKADERTLAMIAEDVDIDPVELYRMQIPLNDGTGRHVSVEALKKGYLGTDADTLSKGRAELSQQQAAFEVHKTEHEQTVVRDRSELGRMMAMLQKHLPPNVVQEARVEAQRRLAEAAADILDRFPGWRDSKVASAWQAQANKTLARYGFSRAESAAISDPRLLSLVDSHIKLLDWQDKVKNPPSAGKKPSKSAKHQPRASRPVDKNAEVLKRARAPGATRDQKLAGVMALLGDFPA